jgi:hypothetical protein
MEFIDIHSSVSEIFNFVIDRLVAIAFWAWLAFTVLRNTRTNIAKEGIGKGLYMGAVVALEAGALAFLIYYPFPQILVKISRNMLALATVRWIILYLAAIIWSYRVRHKETGRHGVKFVLLILTTLLFGWLYDRWLGIFALSVPVLLIYLYIINKVAQVILPTSNPEDKSESWKKARAFFMYLLGVQHPIWLAKAKTGHELEKRLEGSSNEIGKPGIIWTWSHQVVGISKGAGSNRVDGPGLIFTEPFESPLTLIDLRMQSRVCNVNTVTKDGMEVPAIVFIAFAIDKRDSINHRPSRRRIGNGSENFKIDHIDGFFAYSSGRVLATLRTIGINNPRLGEVVEKQEYFWDEWVVKQVEHFTQMVVAERSLDELWRPQQNSSRASALDEIASRLQELLIPKLNDVGINLITARIVNYQLPENADIVQQNIKTWGSYWEQQITAAIADIEMIYRKEVEKAHAYSKSILLNAIAESITKARQINEALPRHVIAQYYIHALEEYIKGQPGLNVSESKKRIEMMKEFLISNRTEGN